MSAGWSPICDEVPGMPRISWIQVTGTVVRKNCLRYQSSWQAVIPLPDILIIPVGDFRYQEGESLLRKGQRSVTHSMALKNAPKGNSQIAPSALFPPNSLNAREFLQYNDFAKTHSTLIYNLAEYIT